MPVTDMASNTNILYLSMCILTVTLTLSAVTAFSYWMFTINQVVRLLECNLQLTNIFSTSAYITNFQSRKCVIPIVWVKLGKDM